MADESEHADVACDACGQTDNHLKVHIAPVLWERSDRVIVRDPTVHFDCIPQQFEGLLGNDEQEPQHAKSRALVKAAREGTHGDDLRALEATLASDNDVEPVGHESFPSSEG